MRPAGPEDFLRVSALLAELGRPRVTPETVDAAQAVYARHVADPETASLVAEAGGEVIGFLSLVFRERLNYLQAAGVDSGFDCHRGGAGAGGGEGAAGASVCAGIGARL